MFPQRSPLAVKRVIKVTERLHKRTRDDDDDPGRRETHKGVGSLPCDISNKPVYASPGCHYGGVRGYTLMTGLLALYLQRCMYGE